MTLEETAMLMDVMSAAYPQFYAKQSEQERLNAVSLWTAMFAEDNAKEVAAAVKTIIVTSTSGFPPSIGEVKDKLMHIRDPDRMTAQEAWTLASKAAAGNLAWNKLPHLVQKAIGSPTVLRDWGLTDIDRFNTVIYSQFVRAYGTYENREREMKLMPPDVRMLVDGLSDKMKMLPKS